MNVKEAVAKLRGLALEGYGTYDLVIRDGKARRWRSISVIECDHDDQSAIITATKEGEMEMTLTYKVDQNDETRAIAYRDKSPHPIARFSHSQTRGWELWWLEPHAVLSIEELHQLAQIGESLERSLPTSELPATAAFIDITKES